MKNDVVSKQKTTFVASVGMGILCLTAFGWLCGLLVSPLDLALVVLTSTYFSFMTSSRDSTISINAVMILCLAIGLQIMPLWSLAFVLLLVIIFYAMIIEGYNVPLTALLVAILLGCGVMSYIAFALVFWLASLILF